MPDWVSTLVWSFGTGAVGWAFALTAFVLGIIGIVKGRTMYGVLIIVGSVCVPVLGAIFTLKSYEW